MLNASYDIQNRFLKETTLLDFNAQEIVRLIEQRKWKDLDQYDRIGAAYDFVRNEIKFGYNVADNIPASKVLSDGMGQCNTKGNLLMALLRALEVPCRVHGFTIHKRLQRGVVPEFFYGLVPEDILHSWVEVYFNGEWINLEGFILDDKFLGSIQDRFVARSSSLCGYGVGTSCLQAPGVEWKGTNTYIQKTGINNDLGIFDNPDDLYAKHMQKFTALSKFLYENFIRHLMNKRTNSIRSGDIPKIPLD